MQMHAQISFSIDAGGGKDEVGGEDGGEREGKGCYWMRGGREREERIVGGSGSEEG